MQDRHVDGWQHADAHRRYEIPPPTCAHASLQIALMFTHDKGVVDTVAALCGWVAIVVVGDGLNAVYSGQRH